MSSFHEALLEHGWEYKGECGGCINKQKSYTHTDFKDAEIKVNKAAGYFYHFKQGYIIKADYIETLSKYLTELHAEATH